MAATAVLVDPYRNFNFLVELDGIAQASFIECSGMANTTEVIETRDGGDNTTVRKLPGKTSHADITLKWGLTDSIELWTWRQTVIDGTFTRKNGSIVVYDLTNQTEVALELRKRLADQVGRPGVQRQGHRHRDRHPGPRQ